MGLMLSKCALGLLSKASGATGCQLALYRFSQYWFTSPRFFVHSMCIEPRALMLVKAMFRNKRNRQKGAD